MRLIDTDELLRKLEEYFNKKERDAKFTGNRGSEVSWNDAIYYIKTAPSAQPEQRWIPCSIKQPPKGLMLVTFNDGDMALLKQPTAYRRSDIVAWMPVEPYMEEGKEDKNEGTE